MGGGVHIYKGGLNIDRNKKNDNGTATAIQR